MHVKSERVFSFGADQARASLFMQYKIINTGESKPPGYQVAGGMSQLPISLQQLLNTLFRRKQAILFMSLLITAGTMAIGLLQPARYKSTMKILVKNERADMVVSPEAITYGDRMAIREETINSEIELLRSKDLLRKIVEDCKLDEMESISFSRVGSVGEKQLKVDRAIERLFDNLEVSPVKKADIIEVSYRSTNPSLPALILQRLAEAYLEKHLHARHSPGTWEFFKTQSKHYEQRMGELKAELANLRSRSNLVDLEEQKKLNLSKLADLEASQLKAEVEYEDNLRRAAKTREALKAASPRIQTDVRVLSNQYSIERLNTMIVDLRNRRTQLLTKFHTDDRLVKEIDDQLRDTQTALDQAMKNKEVEEFTGINPVRPPLEGDLAKLEAGIAGLRVQSTKLAGQLTGYRSRLTGLEAVTHQHKELERQIKDAEANYELYAKKAEEARIAEALDREKIANVAIAEAPIRPVSPYSPNRSLILTLGLLLAVFTGLGWAFAVDFLSDAVHTPAELEALTSLPVFTTVPLITARKKQRGLTKFLQAKPIMGAMGVLTKFGRH
jgi:uncharacterized protein involved in exopolysaccharide biosynthesis